MPVIFCHGLESSPHGRKYQALLEAGLDPISPDFQGQDLAARVATLLPVLRAHDDAVVVGSSYGGITALCAAIQHVEAGGRIHGLLLCAPALLRSEPPADRMRLYPPAPTMILHGRADEIIPVQHSIDFASEHPDVRLELVDDDHRLAASVDRMVLATRILLG